jgi:hypothetical protein
VERERVILKKIIEKTRKKRKEKKKEMWVCSP